MAGKKGRSGRKKKTVALLKPKPQKKNQAAVVVLPPAPVLPPVEIIPDQPQAGKTGLEKLKGKITELKSHIPTTSSEATEAESSPAPAEFEVVAGELEQKYGGSSAETGAGEPAPVSAAAPPLNLNPGVAHVVTPATVEGIIVLVLSGLAKAHGPHWEPSEADKTILVPVYTAAIDEQAPRWFADSPNKAAWLCVLVTVLYIVSRSKNGGKLIEWGMGKINSLVSKVGGSTKTDSLE